LFALDVPADEPLSLNVIATPVVQHRKKRAPRFDVPIVLPEERRFTRSCLQDGYRPTPILDDQPKLKKKQWCKMLLVDFPLMEKGSDDGSADDPIVPPPTPIHVMQRVGIQLGVDPSKITVEKLGADPAEAQSTCGDD
jgi:hypothetical protein